MVSGVPHGHKRRRNSLLAYQQGNNNNQDYQVAMAVPLTAVDVLSPLIQIRRPLSRRRLRQSSRAISQLLISPFFWSDFQWKKNTSCISLPINSLLLIVFELKKSNNKQMNFNIFLHFNCFGLHFVMQCVWVILIDHFGIVYFWMRCAGVRYWYSAIFVCPFGENSFVQVHEYRVEWLHLAIKDAFHVTVCAWKSTNKFILQQTVDWLHNLQHTHPMTPWCDRDDHNAFVVWLAWRSQCLLCCGTCSEQLPICD